MNDDLSSHLERLQPAARDKATWPPHGLELASYLDAQLPPDELISSVRAVLLRGPEVVVLHNRNGSHPLPGGRREAGETLLETLHREIDEEAGCSISDQVPIGFIHFHHVTERPDGHPYPYPDFLWMVFAAEVVDVKPTVDPDGWEERVEFASISEALSRDFEPIQAVFLGAALRALRDG